jgi:Xaa-Pro dipeptidase
MHRIKQIFSHIKEDIDAILIKNPGESSIDENFFYITNLSQGLFEGSYALITPEESLDIFVSALEEESAQKTKAQIHVYQGTDDLNKHLHKSLKSYKKIGLNYARLRMTDFSFLKKEFPKKSFIDISKEIQNTRMVKDANEIDKIHQACRISDKVIEKIPELITSNITESELAAEINYLQQKNGASHPAFDTISSFGKNSAEPHYTHGETKIKQNNFIICDFGATYKRYNSDITRTFVSGQSSKKQKEIHTTVLNAQNIGFDKIQSDIKAKNVHNAVEKAINATKFKGKFIHSTGHSLGLIVHDGPGFTRENELILKENMIFTVEPGIYLPGYGGVRIEDVIRVTKKGYQLLTNSTRDLIEV